MALFPVNCYFEKRKVHLSNYADVIIADDDENIVGIRFGGYPEQVMAMTDAIAIGGVNFHADIGNKIIYFRNKKQNFIRKTSHDGIYAESMLFIKDDIQEKDEAPEKVGTRNMYIFCKTSDESELFTELDRKLSVPLIPKFSRYLIVSLHKSGQLKKLNVYSDSVQIAAYKLTVKNDESDVVKILENGLKKGKIKIPNATADSNAFREIEKFSDYLNSFGKLIAEKIKKSFNPLYEPDKEPICLKLQEVNEYVKQNTGYELFNAQLAAAEGLKRGLDKSKLALVVAECGSGKTKIGASALYAHQKKHSFNAVICPSHVSDKWVRELNETIPNCFAAVLNSFQDAKKMYKIFKKGGQSVYCVMSKEKARDGYMKMPAVIWSSVKKAFICPHCDKTQMMPYFENGIKHMVEADHFFYRHETNLNHKCAECGAVLWSAVNPDNHSSEWVKISDYGFVHRKFARSHLSPVLKLPKLYMQEIKELCSNPDMIIPVKGAYRRYPLSLYFKKKIKRLDVLIIDELHEYSGDSGQGQAMADLAWTAKKTIAMTATLINGYSKGMFYLLFRLASRLIKLDGHEFRKSTDFCKQYGVVESVTTIEEIDINSKSKGIRSSTHEKFLPGVSPLVYTRFLLDNAVFLSLNDMGKQLPDYEEIPIPVEMPDNVRWEYDAMKTMLVKIMIKDGQLAQKIMSAYLNLLTTYPDQPYNQPPVINPFNEDEMLVVPRDLGDINSVFPKDKAVVDLVERKVKSGERVIIYTAWTRLDTREKMLKLLSEKGIRAKILDAKIPTRKREEWIDKQVRGGIDVIITNPALVQTGLDLNAFTTLIFYNLAFNLYVFRQASRRSWRINQTAPKVEVYMFYYTDTLQHKALKLMASKLSAAAVIEGGISDEGLAAMSNCEDLTSQMAKELAAGIKDSVEDLSAAFKKMAIVKSDDEIEQKAESEPLKIGIEPKQEQAQNPIIIKPVPIREKPKPIIQVESEVIQYTLFDLLAG